ncbi:MAG: adenine deaminase [Methylotenera sp.]|nr:adenine deaminase [Oligoflexia bacterium]
MSNAYSVPVDRSLLARRIQAARGVVESDLLLKGVQYLDVFSCEFKTGDVAVCEGVIVGVEPGLKARREIDGKGKWVVPGFIDAHVHVESSLMLPSHFQNAVLPRGTTSAICDPHELANVSGTAGIDYFLNASLELDLDLWVMLSSCVPATHLETNGGGTITSAQLAKLAHHPRALGLAEMMNMPGVLHGDEEILNKILGSKGAVDGHCPLLRGKDLSAYAAAGISSCHESSELEEAREKLTKGIAVWIREGSVAKDLQALIPLLTLATSSTLGFCTDDRNPLDILTQGHLDYLLREAMKRGVAPEVVYRSASWSVARHYGLDKGPNGSGRRTGAIAPGYQADLVVLNDLQSCAIDSVLKAGRYASEIMLPSKGIRQHENTIRAADPAAVDFNAPTGQVHVMGVVDGKIITSRHVSAHDAPGVAKLSVLERYGRGSKPANAYVSGFGQEFKGAIASSVGHDSHNLIAVGSNTEDMRIAMKSLRECGGGFSVVRDGQVLSRLALPMGGLMSDQDPESLKNSLLDLKKASRAVGCELPEPFLQLAFLSLPVIPSLKLTDQGLVDVDLFKVIDVRAS